LYEISLARFPIQGVLCVWKLFLHPCPIETDLEFLLAPVGPSQPFYERTDPVVLPLVDETAVRLNVETVAGLVAGTGHSFVEVTDKIIHFQQFCSCFFHTHSFLGNQHYTENIHHPCSVRMDGKPLTVLANMGHSSEEATDKTVPLLVGRGTIKKNVKVLAG